MVAGAVSSIQNTSVWAKTGVMIRESVAANAPYAFMLATPGMGVAFQRRLTAGANAVGTTVSGPAPPYWVRLSRAGTRSRPRDPRMESCGRPSGLSTIPMTQSVWIGLAVTSHSDAAACTAIFDNVAVTLPAAPATWVNAEVGAVGLTGNAVIAGAAFDVTGSGSDVAGTSDQFRFHRH